MLRRLQLVDREGRDDRSSRPRHGRSLQVAPQRASLQPEGAVGPARLFDRPGMNVHPFDRRDSPGLDRPCRARGTCPTPQIDDPRWRRGRGAERPDDFPDDQKVQRSVKESKCGALPLPCERFPPRDAVTALDIQRGKRLQRAADLREGQVREVSPLQPREPMLEGVRTSCLHSNDDSQVAVPQPFHTGRCGSSPLEPIKKKSSRCHHRRSSLDVSSRNGRPSLFRSRGSIAAAVK